jgi:hypothetical protein
MARPRVFISSTHYDLKHLRSSIENFVEQLGYEPVLSEKDSIAYMPDAPLDESCYREAKNCDIFVLIVGGRYGSPTSSHKRAKLSASDFYERYESITRREFESAAERDVPIYILIDSAVDAEYQTYLKNKDNQSIRYAHVDSVNIFHFIESIRERQKNNPIKLFSRYAEIETWLREQWAGTFRELIQRASTTNRIQDIDSKVAALTETAETLKRYLEQVVAKVSPGKDEAVQLIKEENERLREAKNDAEFRSFGYVRHLCDGHRKTIPEIRAALRSAPTYITFMEGLFRNPSGTYRVPSCAHSSKAFSELNEARAYLELLPYDRSELEELRVRHKKDSELEAGKRAQDELSSTAAQLRKASAKRIASRTKDA